MRPTLHVCITCRAGGPLTDPTPGRAMHSAVAAHPDAAAVDLHEATCLAVCEQGCAAAISMPGKWSYLLGRLNPAMVGDLLTYAGVYAQSTTGAVMPSKRPASLAHIVLGRLPA